MVETGIALASSLRSSGPAARTLAAHLFTLLFLGVWQAASLVAPSYLLPGPVPVVQRLWVFATSSRDLGHLGASLFHVGTAISISFVIGSLLALIPYYLPVLRFAIERRIGPFLNAFSAIGWTLLSIMWFGVTPLTVIFAISAVLVPFALVNMAAGLADLDRETVEMAGSFTRRRWRMFALVIVPSLYPFVFATLRIMFGVAWKVTLTAELFVTPEFLWHASASTWRVLVSIAAALLIGGGLAFLAYGVPWLGVVVDERIKPILNSFPSIGWAILAAIWFNPGDFGVIFVEVAILIPFCLINVAEGLRNIDGEIMEMGRSFTRHRARILWRLTLPLLVPYGLSATRIAYGIAWKIALVAELLGAPSGLGYLMLRAQTAADSTTFLAICFAIVLIFVAGERLVIVPLERRFARR